MIGYNPETALAIASSTNPGAAPIVVTTAIDHGLVAGVLIFIRGHDNVLANGKHVVAATTSNTLTLDVNGNGGAAGTATGNVIPYPGTLGIPEDGEDADASAGGSGATIFSMIAGLADEVAFVKNATVLQTTTYTASGTDVVPDGATFTLVIGWGSGGSGGGGAGGNAVSTTDGSTGGAGGGCARKLLLIGEFTPGSSQAVVIAAAAVGGLAGAAGANGSDGNPGNDSSYGGTLVFPGGGPGSQGQSGFPLTTYALSVPGTSSKHSPTAAFTDPNAYLSAFPLSRQEGEGGYVLESSGAFTNSANGTDSSGFAGGVGGTHGTTSGGAHGGAGGGGGAAGPGGAGGTGGAGGNGGHAGVGGHANQGGAGVAPNPNSGAGGGGGGAGGSGDTSLGGVGANGTVSGTGQITVIHFGAPQ